MMKKILVLAFAVPMIALTGCGRQVDSFANFQPINSQAALPPGYTPPCPQAILPPGVSPKPENPCSKPPKPVYPCYGTQAALPPGVGC